MSKLIITYPKLPRGYHKLHAMAKQFGYELSNDLSRAAEAIAIFHWHDTTFKQPDEQLQQVAEQHTVINYRSTDISKQKVEAAFNQVFQLQTIVTDPEDYGGRMVEKTNDNATSDSKKRIVQGPVEKPKPGYVYQVLLDNRISPTEVEDIRIPIYGGHIPYINRKIKPYQKPFHNDHYGWLHTDIYEVISENEAYKVLELAKLQGFDYGEMDAIRHSDGHLYIIDTNDTPGRQANSRFKNANAQQMLKLQHAALQKAFFHGQH